MTSEMPDGLGLETLEQLARAIAPGSRLARAWALAGGISAGMTAFEILKPDGQTHRLILRQPAEKTLKNNPRATADEFRLLKILPSLGIAAPRACRLDPAGRFLVVEYVEGQLEFSTPPSADFIAQMAAHLAQIHRADGANPALSFLSPCAARLDDRLHSMEQDLEQERIRSTLETVWPIPQRNAPVLLHGDYWPGNLIWQSGRLAAVIDWEDAGLGDPLVDLAIARLDLAWIFGLEAMESFTRAYLSLLPVDTTGLPYRDLYAALRLARMAGACLAEWAAFFTPYGRPDITEQTIREKYHCFITRAFAQLAVQ